MRKRRRRIDRVRMGTLILGKIFLKPNLFYGAEISHGQLIAHVKQATIKTS